MVKNLVVFDMDGVLVDVTDSYRAAIQQTVDHFTAKPVSNETIQDYKNRGGFNDDWILSHQLIQDSGADTPYQEVVDYFQSIFIGGGNGDGLILKERWLAQAKLLENLAAHATLAIFTGRFRWEAQITLDRFAPGIFTQVVGVDDVLHPKPNPEGLLKLTLAHPYAKVWYIGDSVDDAGAALQAKVPFIGIAAHASPRRDELIAALKSQGAVAVVASINELEPLLQ